MRSDEVSVVIGVCSSQGSPATDGTHQRTSLSTETDLLCYDRHLYRSRPRRPAAAADVVACYLLREFGVAVEWVLFFGMSSHTIECNERCCVGSVSRVRDSRLARASRSFEAWSELRAPTTVKLLAVRDVVGKE